VALMAEPDSESWGFAAPAFDAGAALASLKKAMRDLRLVERSGGFESKGRRVVELAVVGTAVQARLARRPAMTPEWDRTLIASQTDLKRFLDETKRRLTRWQDDEQ
jgi:hypothetical protein